MPGETGPPPLPIRRLHPEARIPRRMTKDAAGLDLCACLVEGDGQLTLEPGGRALVPTGLQIAIPSGFEGQIRPRSGLALKHGISIPNAPGTIDADYRGELKVILLNLGDAPYVVSHGDRVAQLVLAEVAMLEPQEVQTLPDGDGNVRGSGGFGSTGR